jgi:protein-S-isoprenylcysteine O-methyltransferase Ste14
MSVWRQLRAIGPLPATAALAAPALIVALTGDVDVGWGLADGLAALPVLLGAALVAVGLGLFVSTVALFARVGRGTLAPWDPPERLVVEGPYRRVRHPMISGVACVLLGEAALLGSISLLVYAGGFVAVNALWLPLVEEPRLRRRFGPDYEDFMERVPRWVPRLRR